MKNYFYFKNIKFTILNYKVLKLLMSKKGGYLCAPAASALIKINQNIKYYNALKNSTINILDSGFFIILNLFFKGRKLKKYSGYLLFKHLLNDKFIKHKKFLLINPDEISEKMNKLFLRKKNIYNFNSYKARFYKSEINDIDLLNKIKLTKPDIIIINLGGGTQERLAQYIVKNIKTKKEIYCLGAAIDFFTGKQAKINDLIDKMFLGWFIRLLHNPKFFFTRVIKSFLLIKFFIK